MDAIRIEHAATFRCPVSELWGFHLRPEALTVLAPPFAGFRVVDRGDGVADGSVLVAEVGPWPLRQRWVALHAAVENEVGFADIALASPFPFWLHQHLFEPVGRGRSRLRDVVWVVPPGWAPRRLAEPVLRLALGLFFRWRHRQTRRAVEPASAPVPRPRPLGPSPRESRSGSTRRPATSRELDVRRTGRASTARLVPALAPAVAPITNPLAGRGRVRGRFVARRSP